MSIEETGFYYCQSCGNLHVEPGNNAQGKWMCDQCYAAWKAGVKHVTKEGHYAQRYERFMHGGPWIK